MFTKRKKLGRTIDEIQIGEQYREVKEIEDKDILLYLGFTNDANPVYIQHDYASRTPFQRPIVPHIMLDGFILSAVSMYLPGPGSSVMEQQISYPKPVYHYGKLTLTMEVEKIDKQAHRVHLSVSGTDEYGDDVIKGSLIVCPPYPWKPMTHDSGTFENF